MNSLRKLLARLFAGSADDGRTASHAAKAGAQSRLELEVGQAWTYRDAPTPTSRVIIGRLDEFKGLGIVVSVCITDVPVPNAEPGDPEYFDIFHAPIAEDALVESLLEKVGQEATTAGFEEGYADWRSSLAAGDSGVFTISPAGVIGLYGRVPRRV